MAVEHTHLGTPPTSDPAVEQAMRVWDNLTSGEQREVFRTVYRAVAAYGRTKDIDRLIKLAESVDGMVHLEQQPGFTQARRAPSQGPGKPGDGVGITEVIRRLRE